MRITAAACCNDDDAYRWHDLSVQTLMSQFSIHQNTVLLHDILTFININEKNNPVYTIGVASSFATRGALIGMVSFEVCCIKEGGF